MVKVNSYETNIYNDSTFGVGVRVDADGMQQGNRAGKRYQHVHKRTGNTPAGQHQQVNCRDREPGKTASLNLTRPCPGFNRGMAFFMRIGQARIPDIPLNKDLGLGFCSITAQAEAMKRTICILSAASLLLAGCGDKSDKPVPAATNAPTQGSTPSSAPADYLGGLAKGQQNAVKVTDVSRRGARACSNNAAPSKKPSKCSMWKRAEIRRISMNWFRKNISRKFRPRPTE